MGRRRSSALSRRNATERKSTRAVGGAAPQSRFSKGRLKMRRRRFDFSVGRRRSANNRKKWIVPFSISAQPARLVRRLIRSSISVPLLKTHEFSPAPAGEVYGATSAKRIVFQFFQEAVNEGWAEWK